MYITVAGRYATFRITEVKQLLYNAFASRFRHLHVDSSGLTSARFWYLIIFQYLNDNIYTEKCFYCIEYWSKSSFPPI